MSAPAAEAVRAPAPRLPAHERVALLALVFLLLATAGWWCLALWPTPSEPPAWLARARWVCFNSGESGMPSASGWLMLIGEPLGLGVALAAIFGRSLRAGLRGLARSAGGRAAIAGFALLLCAGVAAAGARVAALARAAAPETFSASSALADAMRLPRLDRPAPALGLVDQHGEAIDVGALRGRPALVTFAFAHCEAVCPALVSQALAAQRAARARSGEDGAPRLVVVSLDPWRDTPARLPALAASWQLGDDAHVLSGPPERVNATLDGWRVPRERDAATGQLAHPALVYVLDAEGRIAFASTGDARTLGALLGRL